MSSTTTNHIDPVTGEYNGPAFDEHDKRYLRVAAILALITAVEIAASYIEGLKGGALAAVLMTFGLVKFVAVAAEFMHLKFDQVVLRRLFVMGAILASFCYIAILTAMGALETPRLVLPAHWLIFLAGATVAIVMWVVPGEKAAGHDHDDHGHGDHDSGDHGHGDHSGHDHADHSHASH